ncbi:hypothetical protein ACFLT1_01530 [Bacteroidota bacterium]
MRTFKYIFSLVVLFLTFHLYAQQEEVRVVKPYTPTLSGAEKIQLMPSIDDTVSYERSDLEYSIFSKRYETDFTVVPIEAAKMIKPPLEKLYKSQLKLGMGNYLTPLAELRINQVRSSKGNFGFLARHHSMNGQIRLENDQKVAAGFNENQLEFKGKRYTSKRTLTYNAGANYNTYMHYGVDTLYADSVSKENMLHDFLDAHAGIGFKSARADSVHLEYDGSLNYHFFTHAFNQMEHGAVLDVNAEKPFRNFRLGGDLGLSYFGHQVTWDPLLTNQFMIKINPYLSKSTSEWMFRAGFNTYTEIRNGQVLPHFYLQGKFTFNIVKDILVPYFGIDGYEETNNYRKISNENPYIVPGLAVLPTNHKMYVYAGLKGKFTDFLAWNFRGSYSAIDDQYFYATNTNHYFENQFEVLYDDYTVINLHGEFNILPISSLQILLKGNYFYYQMTREQYPWYQPAFDVNLRAMYNLGDKILADAALFVIGPRYYPSLVSGGVPGELGTTVDLNLGVEYRYTKLLSFWARLDNIIAQPYYMWYNYPSYRFRFMLGFTYGL